MQFPPFSAGSARTILTTFLAGAVLTPLLMLAGSCTSSSSGQAPSALIPPGFVLEGDWLICSDLIAVGEAQPEDFCVGELIAPGPDVCIPVTVDVVDNVVFVTEKGNGNEAFQPIMIGEIINDELVFRGSIENPVYTMLFLGSRTESMTDQFFSSIVDVRCVEKSTENFCSETLRVEFTRMTGEEEPLPAGVAGLIIQHDVDSLPESLAVVVSATGDANAEPSTQLVQPGQDLQLLLHEGRWDLGLGRIDGLGEVQILQTRPDLELLEGETTWLPLSRVLR